jgi:hypothetical protein
MPGKVYIEWLEEIFLMGAHRARRRATGRNNAVCYPLGRVVRDVV